MLSEIRRHSEGIDFPSSAPTKHFQLVGANRFWPLDPPRRVPKRARKPGSAKAARGSGLGIKRSQEFSQITRMSPPEYRGLVMTSGVQLGRRKPGDADFAWFVPEPSHVDNDLNQIWDTIQTRRGAILLHAVLADARRP